MNNLADLLKMKEKNNYGAILDINVINKYIFITAENNVIYAYDTLTGDMVDIIPFEFCNYYHKVFENNMIILETIKGTVNLLGDGHIKMSFYKSNFSKKKNWVSNNLKYKLRIFKEIDDNIFLCCGYNNSFEIIKIVNNNIKILLSGNHNNWVNDACIEENAIYTVSHDGWINMWNLDSKALIGVYPVKDGWIYSIENLDNKGLLIGTQYGDIYKVNKDEFQTPYKNCGAIWNIYEDCDQIYAVSEGGNLAVYDTDLNIKKGVKCSLGWLNSLVVVKNKGYYGATSRGEIIKFDLERGSYQLLTKNKYWYNNLDFDNNLLYLATAEGNLVVYSIDRKEIDYEGKISQYQLIDIKIINNNIVIIDVEGSIYIIDKEKRKIDKVVTFNGMHLTSFAYNGNDEILYISTLEGVLILLKRDYTYVMKKMTKGRIWKVDYCINTKSVAFISTSYNISIFDSSITKCIGKIKTKTLGTTCKLGEKYLYLGDEKGNIHRYEISECKEDIAPTFYDISTSDYTFDSIYDNAILFTEKEQQITDTYVLRDETILKELDLNYITIDVSENLQLKEYVISKSGWSKFPQILFWGKFIASASVLAEMFHNGTLLRLINQLEKSETK